MNTTGAPQHSDAQECEVGTNIAIRDLGSELTHFVDMLVSLLLEVLEVCKYASCNQIKSHSTERRKGPSRSRPVMCKSVGCV